MAAMAHTCDGHLPNTGSRCGLLAATVFALAAIAAGPALTSCATVGFYAQAAHGQLSLLLARRDAAAVISDPATPPPVAARLRRVGELVRYAESALALTADGSYGSYVEVEGYPVWYVVAAGEFSVQALPRCYPIIGCAIYRGYFSNRGARREAARLAADYEVHMAGAPAYSTLGWFADPVFSTFLHYDDAALADLIFHELAHRVAYVRDDSAFNESFASFVGEAGAMQWLTDHGGDAAAYQQRLADADAYGRFVGAWRDRLAAIYALPLETPAKRQRKADALAAMRRCYREHRLALGGGRYDGAMAQPYNNARLALAGAYHSWQSAFAALFQESGRDWPAFYRAVRRLAAEPPARREVRLAALRQGGAADDVPPLPDCSLPSVEAAA